MASGIYKLTCIPTGKVYIGQTGSLRQRRCAHFSDLKCGKGSNRRYLKRAFQKYQSKDQWAFETIEECPLDRCTEREDFWIGFYKANDPAYGFNIRKAADSNLGYTHSKETKRKIAEANRKLSPETRVAIKESQRKSYRDRGKGLEFNGEIKLVSEWAEIYQVSKSLVHDRLALGWDLEKALTSPIGSTRKEGRRESEKRRGARTLTYNGEAKLISEWADQFCINRDVINARLKLGWSVDKTLTTPVGLKSIRVASLREKARQTGERLYTFNGETKLLVEWAEQYNIRYDTLVSRLRYGWSLEKALTTPIDKSSNVSAGHRETAMKNGKGMLLNGEIRLLIEWAELYQIPYGMVYDRLYKQGWSLEKALTTPKRGFVNKK